MRPYRLRHLGRALVTVQVEERVLAPPDRRGHREDVFAPARDLPGCLIAPESGSERHEAGKDRVVHRATLYAPPGTQVSELDRIRTPDGLVWRVAAPVQVWPENPFTGSPAPGVSITIEREEG